MYRRTTLEVKMYGSEILDRGGKGNTRGRGRTICGQSTAQLRRCDLYDIEGQIVPYELRLGPSKEFGPFVCDLDPHDTVMLKRSDG